jgi:hypothetical protein
MRHMMTWGKAGVVIGLSLACASVMSAGAKDESAPKVVVHPMTQEERMQESDYLSYEPMMERLDAFGRADPDKLEERARKLKEGRMLTDSPFVDWGRYAAMALADLDPKSPPDQERAASWGRDWAALSALAMQRFEANQEGRAQSIADNALCAYRESPKLKEDCQVASAIRARAADPALESDWPRWILQAAAGLEYPVSQSQGWETYGAKLAALGKRSEQIAELRRKSEVLTRWATLLNPARPRIPYDALAEARLWARREHWSPSRPSMRAPWFEPSQAAGSLK